MSENKSKNSMWDKIPFLQKLKNVKHIEIIVIAIFVAVLAAIYISSTGSTSSKELLLNSDASLEEYAEYLETKLCKVIGEIEGVGNVSVMLTFNGRITYEYATDSEEVTTSSSVTNGTNTKTTINEEVVIITQNGKSTPLVVKEIYPDVGGVLIVADGAKNVAVRLNIISAVQTLLNISDNKIQVLPANS